jgi:hypothetical protein
MATNETKAAWAPGPWRVMGVLDVGDVVLPFVHDANDQNVADVLGGGPGYDLANARLIAAAPDLAAAAARVLDEIPTGKISIAARAALDDLRAALARAEGK